MCALIGHEGRPGGLECGTQRIESNQAAVIFHRRDTAARFGHASHFREHAYRIGDVFENVSGVDEIEGSIREVEMVRVGLEISNTLVRPRSRNLLARNLNTHHSDAFRR
jgi:hypothetical protein